MMDSKIEIGNGGNFWIAIAFMLIMFWGSPDITDAIIHFLMKG